MNEILVGGKKVSNETPALIVAEVGINHDGVLEKAYQLIDMAADAGADVVKFQLFTAKRMYPRKAGLRKLANGETKTIYDVIKDTEVPDWWIPLLIYKCQERGVGFLCTTCDETSTDVLIKNNVDAFKIASSELSDYPLLKYTAQTGKTMLLSEGAATLAEIDRAISEIRSVGNNQIALLHCTKEYPGKLEDSNTNLIETYKRLYPDIIVGFSDHTMEPSIAPVQAIKKGAKIIEKHITLDRKMPGADHCFALEFDHLKKLVKDVRKAEEDISAIIENPIISGIGNKIVLEGEKVSRAFTHRALFAIKPIHKGDIFTKDNLDALRPGNCPAEIDAEFIELLVNNKVRSNCDIEEGEPIRWIDILSV